MAKIDAIVWNYLCKVIKSLEIIEEAVNSALETDAFTSPERAAENAIAECQALIAQYREDLKTTGLSKSARAVLLEDLSKQTEPLEALETELAAIRTGRLSFERVMQEYRTFIDWCQEFKKNGREQATYQEKRDALRFLGVKVYIYKEGAAEGRYKIRLSPPDLMRSLKVIPKNLDIAVASSG